MIKGSLVHEVDEVQPPALVPGDLVLGIELDNVAVHARQLALHRFTTDSSIMFNVIVEEEKLNFIVACVLLSLSCPTQADRYPIGPLLEGQREAIIHRITNSYSALTVRSDIPVVDGKKQRKSTARTDEKEIRTNGGFRYPKMTQPHEPTTKKRGGFRTTDRKSKALSLPSPDNRQPTTQSAHS